jgi:molecular chaperone GrpE (heat shock protein)
VKRELLNQILDLTRKQSLALQQEDIEGFGKMMEQKQVLMEQIDELHIKEPELKKQKEEELLKEIITLDKQNQEEFNRQLQKVKADLTNLRNQRQVSDVYMNPYDRSYEEGILFDKK